MNLTTILIIVGVILFILGITLIVRYNKKEWRTVLRIPGSAVMGGIFGNDREVSVTTVVQREVNTGEYRAWVKDMTGQHLSDLDMDYVRQQLRKERGLELEDLEYID